MRALGVFGQSLLVLTTGRPLLVSGSSPDGMDQAPVEMPQACIAPQSAVSMGTGVAWASGDGLCWFGNDGPRLLTAGIMTREDWQALKPETIIGQMYEGLYFGSYDDGTGRKGFLIAPGAPAGMYFMDKGYEALHFDELQDQLYVLDGVNVQRWDSGEPMTVSARSKIMRLPAPITAFGAAEVIADAYPVTLHIDAVNMKAAEVTALVAANPALSAPTATTLRYSVAAAGRDPFRLPSGWMATDWQIEVSSTGHVQGIAVASSIRELAQV